MAEDRPLRSDRVHRRGTGILLLAIIGAAGTFIVEEIRRPRGTEQPLPVVVSRPELSPRTPIDAQRITGYVGAAACRECHPGESALYARSGHRRTLRRVTVEQSPVVAWLDGRTWKDPEVPEVTWSYHVNGGQLIAERRVDGETESLPLDYGFGSGVHGVTFVSLRPGASPGLDPTGVEHRLSYFAKGPALIITPGQEKEPADRLDPHNVSWGRILGPTRVQECFKCHSTLTSTLAATRLEASTLIPNVSCERCHGAGQAHIEAARRGGGDGLAMRMGYDRPEPWVEVNLCGECHKLPRDLSFDKLSPDNTQLVRLQGVGISLSPCYDKGRSGLRCVSCHDPHARVSTDRARYEAVCVSCHESGAKPKSKPGACPVSPTSNCLDCHMPRREDSGKAWFTDHWIRKPARPAKPSGDHRSATAAPAARFSSPAS